MLLVQPSYKILTDINRNKILKNIERIGRVCYKSEDKITKDSASRFVKMLVSKNHGAMLEHESISVKFITNRSVLAELTRHRHASFAVESQRYVNYNKKGLQFIIPDWIISKVKEGKYDRDKVEKDKVKSIFPYLLFPALSYWFDCLFLAEENYSNLIRTGWKPEQARDILPNATKTEIVITANLREWILIFQLRTAPEAFSQMRQVMIPLLEELKIKLPEIFEGVTYEKT